MADKTSSTMTIDAPKSIIMAVIADFPAYPQWASGVRAAEVLQTDADGRPAQVRFTLDAGIVKDKYVLGYRWLGDDEVRWDLVERGTMVSDLTGAYLLTADPGRSGDSTKVTYELAVGLGVPMLGVMKRRAEKTIIDTALKGLRNRAKQVAGESGAVHE
jgi:polyketide cyclase/dehydrase/lipid transport protein